MEKQNNVEYIIQNANIIQGSYINTIITDIKQRGGRCTHCYVPDRKRNYKALV